jgi:hypothetical protein
MKELLTFYAPNGNPGGGAHRADVNAGRGWVRAKKSLSTQSVIDHFVSSWH